MSICRLLIAKKTLLIQLIRIFCISGHAKIFCIFVYLNICAEKQVPSMLMIGKFLKKTKQNSVFKLETLILELELEFCAKHNQKHAKYVCLKLITKMLGLPRWH